MPDLFLAALGLRNPAVQLIQKVIERKRANLCTAEHVDIRHQLNEREPAAQCCIEKLDASISGVHCAEQVDIRWDAEAVLALRQCHQQAALVQLKERDQLAEHFRHVGAIDLIDEHKKWLGRMRKSCHADALEHAVSEAKRQRRVASIMRPKTFDEVLVAVRRMKRQTGEQAYRIAVVVDIYLEVGVTPRPEARERNLPRRR